ncbi:hypothetical protein OS493_024473, partial [Desmophyllum pertusum]
SINQYDAVLGHRLHQNGGIPGRRGMRTCFIVQFVGHRLHQNDRIPGRRGMIVAS